MTDKKTDAVIFSVAWNVFSCIIVLGMILKVSNPTHDTIDTETCASTTFTGDLPHTPFQNLAGRGRHSAVSASFSLSIGRFAVEAAEMSIGTSEVAFTFKETLLLTIRMKDGLSVITMFQLLVFGISGELKDDTTNSR